MPVSFKGELRRRRGAPRLERRWCRRRGGQRGGRRVRPRFAGGRPRRCPTSELPARRRHPVEPPLFGGQATGAMLARFEFPARRAAAGGAGVGPLGSGRMHGGRPRRRARRTREALVPRTQPVDGARPRRFRAAARAAARSMRSAAPVVARLGLLQRVAVDDGRRAFGLTGVVSRRT